jgi:hypothetical protein
MAANVKYEPPTVPLGKIKRFGPVGPKYEICRVLKPIDDGDWLLAIKLIESGETAEYRYSHMLDDPEAK